MKYLPPILFALLLLAGGFTIWNQDQQIQAARDERASLQRQIDSLTRQLNAARNPAAKAGG